MLVYLDGTFLPKEQARVSVDDRGFLFGDGVYEVTRAVDGRLFQEEAHWARLQYGMRETGIATDLLGPERIREISARLLAGNDLMRGDATVYLQVTRGVAPRSHPFPPAGTEPTLYACAAPFVIPHELRRQGVRAISHPDLRWSRCDIKTVNLLPNVLAKQRAVEASAWEAILVRDGAITEGSSTNVFGVVDGVLRSYPRSNYILSGITRAVIVELAAELKLPLDERPILVDEIGRLEELFLTGTTTDVQGVVELDGRTIGEGVPGPLTNALSAGLLQRMGHSSAVGS